MNPLTRLDPRTHLITASAACSLAILFGGEPAKDFAFATVFLLLLIAASRVRFALLCLLLLVSFHVFVYFMAGAVSETSARTLWLFAWVSRKLFFFVITGVYIMSVITVGDCIKSLEKMKFPWVIVMPFAICFRFLPALAHEGRIIRDALRVRGLFSWPRAVTHPLRTGELFLVTLLFRSIAIGEELSFSVSTRAAGQRRHVWYREKSLGPMDLAFTFLVLGTMTAILVAPWQGILPAWFASLESV